MLLASVPSFLPNTFTFRHALAHVFRDKGAPYGSNWPYFGHW